MSLAIDQNYASCSLDVEFPKTDDEPVLFYPAILLGNDRDSVVIENGEV